MHPAKSLFIAILLVGFTASHAQQPVTKGLTKELPISVENLDYALVHNMDAAGLQRAKTALVGNGKFTEAEAEAMCARANIRNFPPGLNTAQKLGSSATFHATGYVQATFLLPFNGIAEFTNLVWVPMADNPTLQAEYTDGKDLFFFSTSTSYKTKPAIHTMSKAFVAAMKARHNKAQPEPIGDDILIHYNGAESYRALRDAGYTEAEAGRIMELTTDDYMPAGFSYWQREALMPEIKKLKAYRIADYNIGFGMARLYWIPAEDARSAPDSLRPKTDEGAFITAMTSRQDPADKALMNRKFANKPQWDIYPTVYAFYERGGTDAQLAEMEKAAKARTAASKSSGGSGGASSSGVTASGVHYSTADMSGVSRKMGAIILYYGSRNARTKEASISNYYVYAIEGTGDVTDKAGLADALTAHAGKQGYIGYEWLAGYDCANAKAYAKRISGMDKPWTCHGASPVGKVLW